MTWALLLLSHGAFARWAESVRRYAAVAVFGDVLLIAIALITVERLQGVGVGDMLRTGFFFVAFAGSGRHLMGCLLLQQKSAA